MPLPNFMKDSDAMMKGKMKIKHMTNCKGIQEMAKDMVGQYCFNYIGQFGGLKSKRTQEVNARILDKKSVIFLFN